MGLRAFVRRWPVPKTAIMSVCGLLCCVDTIDANDTSPIPPHSISRLRPVPAFAGGPLDASDELAALESVQVALTDVADGSSYVWHRANGRLSGVVQPTKSFKASSGRVCRHIIVILSSTNLTKKAQGVACRQDNGIWRLDG